MKVGNGPVLRQAILTLKMNSKRWKNWNFYPVLARSSLCRIPSNPKGKTGRNVWRNSMMNLLYQQLVHWLPAVVRWTFCYHTQCGFWYEASYYHKDKFDVKPNFRKTTAAHLGLQRDVFLKSEFNVIGSSISDKPQHSITMKLENYHIKDFDQDSNRMVLLQEEL